MTVICIYYINEFPDGLLHANNLEPVASKDCGNISIITKKLDLLAIVYCTNILKLLPVKGNNI